MKNATHTSRRSISRLLTLSPFVVVLAACPAEKPAPAPAVTGEETTSLAGIEEKIDDLTAEVQRALRSPDHVGVHLKGQGNGTQLNFITPPVKPVCKNEMSDCTDSVTWRLQPANRLPTGWKVEITEKSSSPTTGCFAASYVLDAGSPSVPSGTPVPACQQNGTTWGYDVTLYNASATPVAPKIDPLLVMYNY